MSQQLSIFDKINRINKTNEPEYIEIQEHSWELWEDYTEDDSCYLYSYKCKYCRAFLYEWFRIENGSFKKHKFIMSGNIQYNPDYPCITRKIIKNEQR
jgi:hypothetical protein